MQTKYKKGVPRVSNIVEFIFPFEGEDKKRYEDWLLDNVPDKRKRGFSISPDDYLDEAKICGTYIHNKLEEFILTGVEKNVRKHKAEIEGGYNFINQLKKEFDKGRQWLPEQFVIDSKLRFQGTADLVLVNIRRKLIRIYDWKTWGIAKKKWNLKNEYKKNAGKIKKVEAQLSLYADTYRKEGWTIEAINVVVAHESGIYEHSLSIWTEAEIDNALNEFKLKELNGEIKIITNYETMEVRVNSNIQGKPYTCAEVTLNAEDFKELSMEEKIDKAIELQKLLVSKY